METTSAVKQRGADRSQVDANSDPMLHNGELVHAVEVEAERIAVSVRGRLNQIRQEVVAIGLDLLKAKELLKRGRWLPWLEAECGLSTRSAQNYMNVAERFGEQFARLANLRLETVYKLAARSTPDDVVEAVLAKASSGQGLSDVEAAAMLRTANPPRATKTVVLEVLPERQTDAEPSPEPTEAVQNEYLPHRSTPEFVDDADTTTVLPAETAAPTPPGRARQHVELATRKAFEQLKSLKPERLKLLCPALRVCDPADLAMMLEKVLTVKTGASS
jgi:hypothetical protein